MHLRKLMLETVCLKGDGCIQENNIANRFRIHFYIGKYPLKTCVHTLSTISTQESSQADNGPVKISKSIYTGVNVVSVTAVTVIPRWLAMFLLSFTMVDFVIIMQYCLVFHVMLNVLLNFKLK